MEVYVDAARVAVALPVFAYASYLDVRERRVPHRTWYPLVALGALALAADLVLRDAGTVLLYATASLALGAGFGYGFYYLGTFGGADRYALVALGFLFPLYPFVGTPYEPALVPELPLFVLSVLGNTVLVGVAYPLKLLAENAARRDTTNPALMLLARRVPTDELHREFGRVIGTDEDVSLRRSGVLGAKDGDDVVSDVDIVRDYVEWGGFDSLRDVRGREDLRLDAFVDETLWESDDLESDEEALRELASHDMVWISPGIPFVVPIFLGLALALTAGDLLFALTRAVFVL